MPVHTINLPLRASVLAVRAALAAMLLSTTCVEAMAADAQPTAAELTTPANAVEIGAGTASAASAKANEFSGQRGKGPFGVFNLDLRGGAAYDSEDATRYRLNVRDLGLERRSVSAEYGVQGRFRLEFGYDELRRDKSDTYQTPFLGAGTNSLTLPSTWLVPLVPRLSVVAPAASTSGGANARGLSPDVTASRALISGVLTAPTLAQGATAAGLQAADLPLFQSVNLSTKRTRYGLGITYELDPRWQLAASYNHEDKSGLKAMGTVTRYTNGDMSAIIPDLIDQTTEQLNLGVTYAGQKLTVNAAYYGTLFVNNVTSMSWANWAFPSNLQTMSSAPNNQFHQLSLTGSYLLDSTTRLTANASYGRSTQDATLLTDASTPLVPVSSAQGLVVSQGLNLKLVSRPIKGLTLAAAYKFDERDNRTPVNTFGYYDAGELKSGNSVFAANFPGLGSNANLNANRPYSKRLNQFNLDADYALARGQAIKAAAELQKMDRYCSGTWIACVDANNSSEATLRAEWRLNALENLGVRIGLSRAHRSVDYNENAFLALVPAANLSPAGAPGGSTAYGTLTALGLTGYGPWLGLNPLPTAGSAQAFFFANNNALANSLYGNQNRISELPGMRRFNLADRNRDKLRSSLQWQASETLSLQAAADISADRYSHSSYGLTSARSLAINLDGTWNPDDYTALTLYATSEDQRSRSAGNSYTANSTTANVGGFTAISGGCYATVALRNASNKVDPCLDWQADMRDRVDTLGLSLARKNLVGGKLDLQGGISYSQARSDIGMNGGNYANNPLAVAGAAAGTIAAYYIPATALPTVKTDITALRLSGRYTLTKEQAVRIGYSWQHLSAQDWAYDGLQVGGLSGVLPTNEKLPTYNVHTLVVSYQYSWR